MSKTISNEFDDDLGLDFIDRVSDVSDRLDIISDIFYRYLDNYVNIEKKTDQKSAFLMAYQLRNDLPIFNYLADEISRAQQDLLKSVHTEQRNSK